LNELHTLHLGHGEVDQSQLEGLSAPRGVLQRLDRGAGLLDALAREPPGPQVALKDRAVGGAVVEDQRSQAEELGMGLNRLHGGRDLRQVGGKPKHAPTALPRLDADLAAHPMCELTRDRQSETGATVAPGG
jgi:hypothetical protein